MREVYFIALLLCDLFVRAQQAYFSSKPSPGIIKARIGQDVTFNWNFTLEKGDLLLLVKLDYSKTDQFESSAKSIANILSDSSVAVSDAFKRKVTVERTGALTLHNVSVEERGFYKCVVSIQHYSLSDTAQLFVGNPPVIHSSPASKIALLEKSHVDLSCEASGTPDPNVSWYKQSPYGWKKLSEHRLQIKNVKKSDSGLYTCRARNFMGHAEKTVRLTVYERPTVTSFFHSAALDDTIYECEAITFTCEARASSLPVKSVYIYHEGRLVHRSINADKATLSGGSKTVLASGRSRGRLRITEVRKEHKGRYYCVAENEHGFGYNKTIDLKVFAAPKNCERKRTLQTSRTTDRQTDTSGSVITPTVSDHSLPTTKNRTILQGVHSSSGIARPSLPLLTMWICHFIFGTVFS